MINYQYITSVFQFKIILRIFAALGLFFFCRESFYAVPGFNQNNIVKNALVKFFTPKKNITFIDILKSDQHDPVLIDYIKTRVLIPPSGKPYNFSKPNVTDPSQFRQGKFLREYFKEKKSGTFIEVGAYDGEELSNTLILERQLGWTGLLIEPNRENFKGLSSKNRKAYSAQSCISLTASSSTLELSLYRSGTQIIDSSNRKTNKRKTFQMNCFPLYSLMVAASITTIDLISLDVESFEVKILQTIPWNDVNIKSLLIEVNHIPEGKEYLKQFMAEKNYTLNHTFPIDFFFVKNF